MRRELRTLYFSAFQSHLWNLMLGRWIESYAAGGQIVPVSLKVETLPFPRRLDPEAVRTLSQTMLALPCCRSPAPEGQPGEIVAELLKGFGLTWHDLRIRHLKDVFFSKGARPCLFFPDRLEFAPIKDELHPGRHGLRLSFELSKGSYATILVKRLTDVAASSP